MSRWEMLNKYTVNREIVVNIPTDDGWTENEITRRKSLIIQLGKL